MRAIWKYILDITDAQCLDMPSGAKILCVQMQGKTLCLWAVVDPAQPKVRHTFRVYGTGHPLDDNHGVYLGTVQVGMLVFHVFEVK